MKVRQKLKSEPEEGGAYETNIKIKKEAEVRTYHSMKQCLSILQNICRRISPRRTKSEDDDDASGTR